MLIMHIFRRKIITSPVMKGRLQIYKETPKQDLALANIDKWRNLTIRWRQANQRGEEHASKTFPRCNGNSLKILKNTIFLTSLWNNCSSSLCISSNEIISTKCLGFSLILSILHWPQEEIQPFLCLSDQLELNCSWILKQLAEHASELEQSLINTVISCRSSASSCISKSSKIRPKGKCLAPSQTTDLQYLATINS